VFEVEAAGPLDVAGADFGLLEDFELLNRPRDEVEAPRTAVPRPRSVNSCRCVYFSRLTSGAAYSTIVGPSLVQVAGLESL
jgi:hypothetical protein